MDKIDVKVNVKVCVQWAWLKPGVTVAIDDVVYADMIESRWHIIAWYWLKSILVPRRFLRRLSK
jgi:hypothetical protein